jgi:hypothetical protein
VALLLAALLAAPALAVAGANGGVPRLVADLARVRAELDDPQVFDADTCARYIDTVTAFLLERGTETYLPRGEAGSQRLLAAAPALLEDLFDLRLALRRHLLKLHAQDRLPRACVDQVRRAFRFARFFEEYIAEWITADQVLPVSAAKFSGAAPQLYVNPQHAPLRFESGDVFLTRAAHFFSATIARIGDEDGQFSHLAMLYRDPEGEPYVVESLIEAGLVVTPFHQWRAAPHARAMVFRPRDRAAAHHAAERMAARARAAKASGKPVPYDLQVDLDDPERLFCAEVVRHGMAEATGGRTLLPTYPTRLTAFAGHGFLEALGIRGSSTFAPGDLEVEPTMDLVAEWRNPLLTERARIEDAALTAMYAWITEDGYRLVPGAALGLRAGLAHLARKLGFLAEQLPPHLKGRPLRTLMAIEEVATALTKALAARDEAHKEAHGRPMTYPELLAELEDLRAEDCARYQAWRAWPDNYRTAVGEGPAPPRPLFHIWLHRPLDRSSQGWCFGVSRQGTPP